MLAVLAVVGRSMPAYAAWQQQEDCWKYEQDGGWVKSSWVKDSSGWYYLGEEGKMETGWKKIGGFWYFLNPKEGRTWGRMFTGWQWIDGRCYYLSDGVNGEYPEGAMYANGQTPDGYWVDESGAWVDARGEMVEIPGKGISTRGPGDSEYGKAVSAGGSSGGRKSSSKGGSSGSSKEGSSKGSMSDSNGATDFCLPEKTEPSDSEISDLKATHSNAIEVNWQVHFVDRDTHQALLAESRQGRIQDGEKLVVNFRNRIVDRERRVWESVEKPPIEIPVYGPGDQIYYVEYVQLGMLDTPEDPFEEARERLGSWLEVGKLQEAEITGEDVSEIPDSRLLVESQREANQRLLTIAGQIPPSMEYAVYLIGKNHEPEGMILKDHYGDLAVYSKLTEDQFLLEGDVYTVVRFSVKRELEQGDPGGEREADTKESWDKIHWNVGDVLTGEIDGESYRFRCIDQNYSDLGGNHQEGALFLCDSVIPANTGSSYTYELLKEGSYGYVFCPGPVVNFGNGNDYKYSNIRRWLEAWEDNFYRAKDIDIGSSFAYLGSTGQGMYDQLRESDLKGYPIGNQKLTGKLFILSVDEALKYRDWLWRFDGSVEENSLSQTGAFSKGYWLRSPGGTSQDHDTGLVYQVDLENGKICPVKVSPEGGTEDLELQVTSPVGVRPAFVMPQQ